MKLQVCVWCCCGCAKQRVKERPRRRHPPTPVPIINKALVQLHAVLRGCSRRQRVLIRVGSEPSLLCSCMKGGGHRTQLRCWNIGDPDLSASTMPLRGSARVVFVKTKVWQASSSTPFDQIFATICTTCTIATAVTAAVAIAATTC